MNFLQDGTIEIGLPSREVFLPGGTIIMGHPVDYVYDYLKLLNFNQF